MTSEKKERQPLNIKNLADFKRHIKVGTELKATFHKYHTDIVGLTRVVTKVQTNGFYSKIKDQPNHKWSTCNYGKGFRTDFEKAEFYRFSGSTIQLLDSYRKDGSVICEIEIYGNENSMKENQQEESDMNEWDRLHRQAEHYKAAYPPGTRIMLLHMGDDPRPIEDNMRGTVKAVDDLGTLHCSFDNGRSLGIVPGEDSFRKLTDEELAEEQIAEEQQQDGPVLGM